MRHKKVSLNTAPKKEDSPAKKQGGWRANFSPKERKNLVAKIIRMLQGSESDTDHSSTFDGDVTRLQDLATRLEQTAWLQSKSKAEYTRKIARKLKSTRSVTTDKPAATSRGTPATLSTTSPNVTATPYKCIEGRIIEVPPSEANHWYRRIHPEVLCINTRTGERDVSQEFFDTVWNDHLDDPSWRCWVFVTPQDVVMGAIIIQEFVHESNYFRWGRPLAGRCKPADPATGAFGEIVEISFLCGKGCGTKLLHFTLDYIKNNTSYKWVVLNSTVGAKTFYEKWGWKTLKAYRLPMEASSSRQKGAPHLYRHRMSDDQLDPEAEPPSIMMYLEVTGRS
jgi:hypothetical protein